MIASMSVMQIRKCDSKDGTIQCFGDSTINDYVEDIQIDTWVGFKQVNFLEHEKEPMFTVTENAGIYLLDANRATQNILSLKLSSVETQDSHFSLGWKSYFDTFATIGFSISFQVSGKVDPGLMYEELMFMFPESVKYTRQVYGILDLLGDLGGVTEVIMICFGIFLFPISEHSFNMKAA